MSGGIGFSKSNDSDVLRKSSSSPICKIHFLNIVVLFFLKKYYFFFDFSQLKPIVIQII